MAKEFKSGDILTAADMNNIVTDLETSKTDINDLKSDLGGLSFSINFDDGGLDIAIKEE